MMLSGVQYKRVNKEMPVRLLLGKQKAYGHFFFRLKEIKQMFPFVSGL